MVNTISKLETLVGFGFKHNPFRSAYFKTSDSIRIERVLGMAVKERVVVSIVGDRGGGKTKAVTGALKKLRVRQVLVRAADKDRLLITDIEQALILDLSDEKPKRGREIRARQLRRILGEASQKHDIVLVIEEGHRLHGMTLRALKSLREVDWMGENELFTIILIAQSDPMNKAGVAEVRLRADTVHMHGLTANEIVDYIQGTVGKVFDKDAVSGIASLPDAWNYLNLQEILLRVMARALVAGRDVVTYDDVLKEFSGNADIVKSIKEAVSKGVKKEAAYKDDTVLKNVITRF